MEKPIALVVGEALTDIAVRPNGDVDEYPGGSPMNVAVGLARLGVATEFHTSIGQDARGEAIARHLAASGVQLTDQSALAPATSTARATIGASGAAEYDFELRWQPVPGVRAAESILAVHTGSLAAVMRPGASEVVEIVREARSRCTISYDPNVRAQLMGSPEQARRAVEELVSLSDVVKSSDEDLEWLYPGRDPLHSAADWAGGGTSLVVVTRGRAGAWAKAGRSTVAVDAPSVAVVDTIGAGDSFMAGLIAALADRSLLGSAQRDALASVDEGTLRGIIEFAATCAAITVTRPGADPPSRRELVS